MKTIKLKQYGGSMGTRELGEKIRNGALSIVNEGSQVLFDFTGIDIISSAFADELFGKLYAELGDQSFKKNIKVNCFSNENSKSLILTIINKGIAFRKKNLTHNSDN